jgi:hypothetical protein
MLSNEASIERRLDSLQILRYAQNDNPFLFIYKAKDVSTSSSMGGVCWDARWQGGVIQAI